MKVVSQNWIDNQKKQIRPKTHIRIKILETGKIYQTLSDYTGNVITLNDEDLYGFSYQSHVSPANEDLPYQKIQFDLLGIDYDFAKRIPCYVETSQYSGEWIGLGCGYFYLDEIRKDRKNNRTTLKFVDCVSTFTIKNRMIAMSNPLTYQEAGFDAMMTSLMGSDESRLPETLNFPNRNRFYIEADDSDITSYFASGIANPNGFLSKTVAESLYLIAQACGGMLYINGSNWVRMNALDDPSYNERMFSIGTLEKCDFESQRKVKKVSVSRKKEVSTPYSTETIISSNEWQYDSNTGKYFQSFDLESIYYNIYYHSSGFDSISITPCWVYVQSNSGSQTFSIGGNKGHDYSTAFFTTYTLDNDGEVNIDLELLVGNKTPTGTDGALELLKRVYAKTIKFTTIVRFDTRFECGDFFTLEEGDNEFQCLLTDINFTYNGSLKATISGLVWGILAPVLIECAVEDGYASLYNPNDFDVELIMKWSSVVDNPIKIKAKSRLDWTLSMSSHIEYYDPFQSYYYWGNEYDLIAYFRIGNVYFSSDNTLVLEENLNKRPIAPIVNIEWDFDEDYISLQIKNPNQAMTRHRVAYPAEGWTFLDRVFYPNEEVAIEPAVGSTDYNRLKQIIEWYLNSELDDNFTAWNYNGSNSNLYSYTIIFEA